MSAMRSVALLGMLVCLLLVGGASAFLAGYGYYQDVTINNGGASNLTNYQMQFTVNTSSGTSSGTTIYLNSHSNASLNDLRFTDTSDNLYDYFIETAASPYTVWVEVPSIIIGNSTLRVQYGNAGASAVSNGTNTFIFFDSFSGSSLDATKWTTVNTPTVSISGSYLTLNKVGAWGGIYSNTAFGTGTALRVRGQFKGTTTAKGASIGYRDQDGGDTPRADFLYWDTTPTNQVRTKHLGVYTNTNSNIDTTERIWEIQRNGTTSVNFIKDTSSATGSPSTTNIPTAECNIYLDTQGESTYGLYIDRVLIRLYPYPLPTGASWSGESATTVAPVAAFSANRTTGAPGNISFTDASTNTPTSWAWSFDDGGPNSTDQNPVHTFASAGTYTIILTATNAAGSDVEEKVDYITLTDAPVAAFHANTTSGYAPLSVLFTDDSTNTPTSWVWEWGDATANGTTQNPNHTYTTAGTFNVTLTATNAGGSDSETKLAYITTVALVAFPGCAAVPTDLDADGLYEDINGNTRKDWSDIILFFKYRIWAAANEPPAAFDWNGNGIIDYKDVLMLYDEGV